MRLQMAAIALVSAMLGGVFGIAVWRAAVDRDVKPGNAAAPDPRIDEMWKTLASEDVVGKDGPIGLWWCATQCFRSEEDCDLDVARGVAETKHDKHPLTKRPCTRQRVAFCSSRCFDNYAMCTLMEYDGKGARPACFGVE